MTQLNKIVLKHSTTEQPVAAKPPRRAIEQVATGLAAATCVAVLLFAPPSSAVAQEALDNTPPSRHVRDEALSAVAISRANALAGRLAGRSLKNMLNEDLGTIETIATRRKTGERFIVLRLNTPPLEPVRRVLVAPSAVTADNDDEAARTLLSVTELAQRPAFDQMNNAFVTIDR